MFIRLKKNKQNNTRNNLNHFSFFSLNYFKKIHYLITSTHILWGNKIAKKESKRLCSFHWSGILNDFLSFLFFFPFYLFFITIFSFFFFNFSLTSTFFFTVFQFHHLIFLFMILIHIPSLLLLQYYSLERKKRKET